MWLFGCVTIQFPSQQLNPLEVNPFSFFNVYMNKLMYTCFAVKSVDGATLKEVASNGLAFVKLTLEQDFQISNLMERSKLTRLIIQLFPDLNPHLNSARDLSSALVPQNEDLIYQGASLPAYEE